MDKAETQHDAPNKLEVRNPHKVQEVLALLGSGASLRTIREQTGVAVETIQRIREEHPLELAKWRSIAAAKTQAAIDGLMDEILGRISGESLNKERMKDLALSLGILTDKKLLLEGEATNITETRQGVSMDKAQEAILKAKQAEVIDV